MIPPTIATYLSKRACNTPWCIAGQAYGTFAGAVVIPALSEYVNLPHTLKSLAANPPELLERFLILVVVNQRADAEAGERADNLATLAALPGWRMNLGLANLHWVDAASPGLELPDRQGVGLARKIGLDLALPHLDYRSGDPLLICLDSDTLVQPDYLPAIASHFASATAGGASLPYRHQPANDSVGQLAIDRYELFLRAYVLGLQLAGSPWAFHTVGSAMACRASAYAAAGGMNKRLAGEDFYFLQQIHKVAGVAELNGTMVYPSPRSSHRVPFGTGRAVGDMLARGERQLLFYQPQLFDLLGSWLKIVAEHAGENGAALLARGATVDAVLGGFLWEAGFAAAWDNLRRHNPDQARLMAACHCWLDAFRTMRLLHHLTDNGRPRIEPEEAVAPLLVRCGYVPGGSVAEMLEILRAMQGGK